MFARIQNTRGKEYLLIVENYREGDKVKQKVLHRFGRLDKLKESGGLDGIIASMSKFSDKLSVLSEHAAGNTKTGGAIKIGAPMIFERLWRELGIGDIIQKLLSERKFEFSI